MTSEIKVDTISENTSANGVTIDGVKLKDNVVTVQGTSTTGGIIEIENTDTSGANGDFIGKINFKGNDSSGGASGTRAAIEAKVVSNFGSTELHFKTAGSGASATDAMIIDSAGHITKPLQPAFLVSPSDAAAQNNISGSTVITFGDEIFDQNADFASNTFTAPVTGRYQLNASLRIGGLDADATYHFFQIETSNRNYQWIIDPRAFDADPVYWPATWSALADMDANDTAYIKYYQSGGADQLDIETGGSFFSGFLAC